MSRTILINMLIIACIMPTSSAIAQSEIDPAWEALLDVNYRYEVAGYCGLVNPSVQRGYQAEESALTIKYQASKKTRQEASGKGWQAAHKEWLNRGLGGFKRWCRNEGADYAAAFLRTSQLSR